MGNVFELGPAIIGVASVYVLDVNVNGGAATVNATCIDVGVPLAVAV